MVGYVESPIIFFWRMKLFTYFAFRCCLFHLQPVCSQRDEARNMINSVMEDTDFVSLHFKMWCSQQKKNSFREEKTNSLIFTHLVTLFCIQHSCCWDKKKKNVHGFFTFQICFAIIWFGARELHWSAGAQMFNAADRSGGGCMFSHLSHHWRC